MPVRTEDIGGVPATTVRILAPDPTALVLIIPGNPGVATLYTPLAERIVAQSSGRVSVAVASYAGHVPGHVAPSGFFSLADQLAHQQAFLATLPAAPVVHVVGHSIGAWLTLSVLDGLPEGQRGRGFLLFPTIERMAGTPAGRHMSPLFGPLRHPAVALSRMIRRLPGRDRLLTLALLRQVPPADQSGFLDSILALSPDSLHNVLQLAGEELATVTSLPEALLTRHAERLTFYYGDPDPWNLPDMADGVAARFPDAEVIRCTAGIPHAFMFGGSAAMADLITQRLHS
ncbi:MAG: pimeloyl-ACP methyl ester carboxylesterase [Myxococcota bacterium]|jgi:pimeloyl-ACP methyl ester carboxylesterase